LIVVELINPGNFLALSLKLSPTGEKHKHKCKLRLILNINYLKTDPLSGFTPGYSALNGFVSNPVKLSISSSGNKPDISPLDNKSLN